jgi:4-diphosphocytidyl-2C-methyl-D-erythritol kinase
VADRDILHAASAAELSELLSNHLETAVFRVCPAVYSLREALNLLDLTSVHVTGSGSTLYCLFDDPEPALRAANKIQERWSQVTTVVAAAPVGQGPIFSEEC